MAIKIETNTTTTLVAKKCNYSNGKFFSENEVIDWDSLLNNFSDDFEITIKEKTKENLTEG